MRERERERERDWEREPTTTSKGKASLRSFPFFISFVGRVTETLLCLLASKAPKLSRGRRTNYIFEEVREEREVIRLETGRTRSLRNKEHEMNRCRQEDQILGD